MNQKLIDYQTIIKDIKQIIAVIDAKVDLDLLKHQVEELHNVTIAVGFWNDSQHAQQVLLQYNVLNNKLTNVLTLKQEFSNILEFIEVANEQKDNTLLQECNLLLTDLHIKAIQIKLEVIFNKKDDLRDCYLEIHAGSGGVDAQDWAMILMRMYLRWAEKNKFKTHVVDENYGEVAGIKSVVIKVSGNYAFAYLKPEIGVHRLVRISPFNSEGKRQTSFASVVVYPFIDDHDTQIEVNNNDITIQTYRASGAGGQHVNTTDSAVRVIHHPSGIVVTCQNERSQYKNKESALSLLRAKLLALKLQQEQDLKQDTYEQQNAIDFGYQIRSYVMHPYSLVKDHRTLYETASINNVLDGEINNFIYAYLTQDDT